MAESQVAAASLQIGPDYVAVAGIVVGIVVALVIVVAYVFVFVSAIVAAFYWVARIFDLLANCLEIGLMSELEDPVAPKRL